MYLQTPQMNRFCSSTLVTKSLRDGTSSCIRVLWFGVAPPNNHMQRAGMDKVQGRGQSLTALVQVCRARVLRAQWPVADVGR
jgi:hypothetical protein